MSIDVSEKEHKNIKMHTASLGISIRKFVTECILEKIIQAGKEQSQ